MLTRRWGLSTQKVQLEKAMTFRLAILHVGIAGVNGVLRVHVVPGGAPLLLSKEFLRDLGCHIDLGKRTVAAFASTLDEFWATRTQDPS